MTTDPHATRDGEPPAVFSRELGLTHAEFLRFLPPAIAHRPFTVAGDRVRVEDGHRSLTIELGPQHYRRIASLRLPYVEARFVFDGYTGGECRAFMARFERCFQRGGG